MIISNIRTIHLRADQIPERIGVNELDQARLMQAVVRAIFPEDMLNQKVAMRRALPVTGLGNLVQRRMLYSASQYYLPTEDVAELAYMNHGISIVGRLIGASIMSRSQGEVVHHEHPVGVLLHVGDCRSVLVDASVKPIKAAKRMVASVNEIHDGGALVALDDLIPKGTESSKKWR